MMYGDVPQTIGQVAKYLGIKIETLQYRRSVGAYPPPTDYLGPKQCARYGFNEFYMIVKDHDDRARRRRQPYV